MIPRAARRYRSWRFVAGKAGVLPSPRECTNQDSTGGGRQGKQRPRGCLRICRIKVGEEVGVARMPQAAGIVGHEIDRPRDIMVPSHIAMMPLVKGIVLEKVGACRYRRR